MQVKITVSTVLSSADDLPDAVTFDKIHAEM